MCAPDLYKRRAGPKGVKFYSCSYKTSRKYVCEQQVHSELRALDAKEADDWGETDLKSCVTNNASNLNGLLTQKFIKVIT